MRKPRAKDETRVVVPRRAAAKGSVSEPHPARRERLSAFGAHLGQERRKRRNLGQAHFSRSDPKSLSRAPRVLFFTHVLGFWPRQPLALQYTPPHNTRPLRYAKKTTFAKNKRRPQSTPVPTEPSPSSAALGEHWQAVVRANVGAARQPLVDAPGVEDVAACVSKGVESVTVSTEQL